MNNSFALVPLDKCGMGVHCKVEKSERFVENYKLVIENVNWLAKDEEKWSLHYKGEGVTISSSYQGVGAFRE